MTDAKGMDIPKALEEARWALAKNYRVSDAALIRLVVEVERVATERFARGLE